MARFLAYTSPARGHLYPVVPTLLELAAGATTSTCARCHRGARARGGRPPRRAASRRRSRRRARRLGGEEPAEGSARIYDTFPNARPTRSTTCDVRSTRSSRTACSSTSPRSGRPRPPRRPDCHGRAGSRSCSTSRSTRRRDAITSCRTRSCRRAGRRSTARDRGRTRPRSPRRTTAGARRCSCTSRRSRSSDRARVPASFRLVGPGVWEPPPDPVPWLRRAGRAARAGQGVERAPGRRRAHPDRARGTRRRGRSRSSCRRLRTIPAGSRVPATSGSRAGCRTCRSCSAPQRGLPRRHGHHPEGAWPRAYRCASCRSDGTSSRWPSSSALSGCGKRGVADQLSPGSLARPSERRSRCARVPNESPKGSARRVARPRRRTRSKGSSVRA